MWTLLTHVTRPTTRQAPGARPRTEPETRVLLNYMNGERVAEARAHESKFEYDGQLGGTDSWEELCMCNELACNLVSRLCLVIRGRCVSPCDGVGSLSGKLSSRSRTLLSALSEYNCEVRRNDGTACDVVHELTNAQYARRLKNRFKPV